MSWPCGTCTFENHEAMTICELCSTAKPEKKEEKKMTQEEIASEYLYKCIKPMHKDTGDEAILEKAKEISEYPVFGDRGAEYLQSIIWQLIPGNEEEKDNRYYAILNMLRRKQDKKEVWKPSSNPAGWDQSGSL